MFNFAVHQSPNCNLANLALLNSMDTNKLKTFYKHQLASLKKLIKDDARHCILTCPDIGLLTEIIDIMHLEYKESFDTVQRKLNPSNKFTNALLLIRMDDKKRIELQRQLYTIFELNDDNFAILYTNQVDCIDTMEKRVRSRYNNEYIHFPLFHVKNKKRPNIEIPTPTLNYYITNGLATKYRIPNIKIADIYGILTPLHISILILSRLHELNNRTIYENYQKFVIDTPALRKRSAADVLNCFYDLQNLQLINKKFSGDWIGLKEYIKENSPIYLHLLLLKVNK